MNNIYELNQSLFTFAETNKIKLMTWKELINYMESIYKLNTNSDEKFCLTEIISYIKHIYQIKK